MNNFLDFIKKDIDAKKTLISTIPTAKSKKIKFNKDVESILNKYEDYRANIKNYLVAKSRKFETSEEKQNVEKIKSRVVALENVKFLLNPSNTYLEKMGFDVLLYKINNFYTFNFESFNDVINGFLDKFELIGIKLQSDDFNYTCYVHEYMTAFLEVRYKKRKGYDKASQIFEQIYWINPELINHIELNFRKLIKDNAKKFNNYILELQKDVMRKNSIDNYADCLEKLQDAYIELNMSDVEDISDLISMAKNGTIDVNQFFEDNKIRKNAIASLIHQDIDISNEKQFNKVCTSLEKLKLNIEEYSSYLEFEDLFINFKNEYEKMIPTDDKKIDNKSLKELESEINKKEDKLEKINRKIFGGRPGLFEFKNETQLKQLKAESVILAKELYKLYESYDQEYFKSKAMECLNRTLSVSEVLHLYYSFDYFKKIAIQKVYNITNYDDIEKYSENFDLFAMNPTNIIITGVPVFEKTNIPEIIVNKYRLNKIEILEEDLSEENLKILLNKIILILRINIINNSNISADELWFISKVENIIKKESKINQEK